MFLHDVKSLEIFHVINLIFKESENISREYYTAVDVFCVIFPPVARKMVQKIVVYIFFSGK